MNHFEKVFRCFPLSVQQQIEGLPEEIRNTVEETVFTEVNRCRFSQADAALSLRRH